MEATMVCRSGWICPTSARGCTTSSTSYAATFSQPPLLQTSPALQCSFLPPFLKLHFNTEIRNPRQLRAVRCEAKPDLDQVRYPNIPKLRKWAQGDGTRRLAPWEEAELPIPGDYQAGVSMRDPVLDNARQFRTLQQEGTVDGSNYAVISHIGERANRDYYNNMPERLRYGAQAYMAATDEYEEIMANKLTEVEPVFKQEALYRTAVSRWQGQPSSREKRLQRYRARRAEVEAAKKGSA